MALDLPRLQLSAETQTVQLLNTTDATKPLQPTTVELTLVETTLHARFLCQDTHPWATYTERDQPIFEEEVVELFLAPGPEDPHFYFEFEVSPDAVLWDGTVASPNLNRQNMVSDPAWDCPDLQWGASQHPGQNFWEAWLSIPLESLHQEFLRRHPNPPHQSLPTEWRANFYRIDRPQNAPAEYTAWSPTLITPADFHRPKQFGYLDL